MAELLAGVGRCTLVAPRGITLIGYGDRWRGASGVRDPLLATALWLAASEPAGGGPIALLSLDMLCLHEVVVERLRREVQRRVALPPERLMVACSHTHAAPVAYADRWSSPRRRRWIREVVERGAEAVARAASDATPAGLRAGTGEAHVAVNRRARTAEGRTVIGVERSGFVDRTLGVLEVASPHGRARALIVSFACHPAVLSPRNRQITAEWPGVLRRELEAETGATVLFLQGATGNLNPDHEWGDGDFEAMERIGREVAAAVQRTRARGLPPIEGLPLAGARSELEVAVVERRRPDGSRESYRATGARRVGVPPFVVDPILRHLYPWGPRLRAGRTGAPVMPLEIQALRAGDFALASHAAETFSETGAAIRTGSPIPHTFFAGYANGMIGYLPTAEAHAAGGYEVEEAPLAYRVSGLYAPATEKLAVDRTLALLSSLWEPASPGA